MDFFCLFGFSVWMEGKPTITAILKWRSVRITAAVRSSLGKQGKVLQQTFAYITSVYSNLQYINSAHTFMYVMHYEQRALTCYSSGCSLRCHVSWFLQKIPVPLKASCFLTWSFLPWRHLAFSPTGTPRHPRIGLLIEVSVVFALTQCVVSCRQSELLVTLNRQLERCLRNSRCIDMESLCVISGEKVTPWMMLYNVIIVVAVCMYFLLTVCSVLYFIDTSDAYIKW